MGVKLAFQLKNLSGLINPKVLAYRKKNGLTHKEYIELVKRDFEIVAEMSMDEILDLSPEEFNEIVRRIDREGFRLEIAQDGYAYYSYKNLYLSKFTDENGKINYDKVQKKYREYEVWEQFKDYIVYRDYSGKEYVRKTLVLEEKFEQLKPFFPMVDKILVDEEKKLILMDFLNLEIRHLDLEKSAFCQPGFRWKEIGDNEECRYIREGLNQLAGLNDFNLEDPVEYYLWTYLYPSGRNYVRTMDSISIGSQHYLNYLVDKIEDDQIIKILKEYTITSNFVTINPIADNAFIDNAVSFCIKYQEKEQRNKEIVYCYKYKDGEQEPLALLGYNVVFYDLNKREYIRE